MYKALVLCITLLFAVHCNKEIKQNLNILVSCDISTKSHVKGIFEISENLISAGHKVTFASFETNRHYTKGYNISSVLFEGGFKEELNFENVFTEMEVLDAEKVNFLLANRYKKILEFSYSALFPKLNELVVNNHYDLMICDFISSACHDVAQKNGIPLIIGFQSLDMLSTYFPKYKISSAAYSKLTTEGMGFLERYKFKVINKLQTAYRLSDFIGVLKKQRKLNKINANTVFGNFNYGLGLGNTFVGFEVAQELPQNMQLVGPIMSKHNQNLDNELEGFLDTHPRILYVAFGSAITIDPTNMSYMLSSILTAIDDGIIDGAIWGLGKTKDSLKHLPETIKYGQLTIDTNSLIENQHPNIKLLTWAPQRAILDHRNIKVFVSHGGIESIFESAHSKTAILCIPLIGDQLKNAAKVEKMGIGKYLAFENIIKEPNKMVNSIKEIVEDGDGVYEMNLDRVYKMVEGTELRKKLAAKMIQDYVYTSKLCRKYKPYDPQSDEPPCELEPLLPPVWKIDFNRLHSIDIIFVNVIIILFTLYLIYYFAAGTTRKISTKMTFVKTEVDKKDSSLKALR